MEARGIVDSITAIEQDHETGETYIHTDLKTSQIAVPLSKSRDDITGELFDLIYENYFYLRHYINLKEFGKVVSSIIEASKWFHAYPEEKKRFFSHSEYYARDKILQLLKMETLMSEEIHNSYENELFQKIIDSQKLAQFLQLPGETPFQIVSNTDNPVIQENEQFENSLNELLRTHFEEYKKSLRDSNTNLSIIEHNYMNAHLELMNVLLSDIRQYRDAKKNAGFGEKPISELHAFYPYNVIKYPKPPTETVDLLHDPNGDKNILETVENISDQYRELNENLKLLREYVGNDEVVQIANIEHEVSDINEELRVLTENVDGLRGLESLRESDIMKINKQRITALKEQLKFINTHKTTAEGFKEKMEETTSIINFNMNALVNFNNDDVVRNIKALEATRKTLISTLKEQKTSLWHKLSKLVWRT